MQIATYKVRTVRVLEENQMTDSANDGSGHIDKSSHHPSLPNMNNTSSVRMTVPTHSLQTRLRSLPAGRQIICHGFVWAIAFGTNGRGCR